MNQILIKYYLVVSFSCELRLNCLKDVGVFEF